MISHGVQSQQGAICRSRLLTVTSTLRQQGRDGGQFLEQAWMAHHRGTVLLTLLPDPCIRCRRWWLLSSLAEEQSGWPAREEASGP